MPKVNANHEENILTVKNLGLSPNTIAGFISGICTTLIMHPLDLLKIRMQVDTSLHFRVGGTYQAFLKVIKSPDGNFYYKELYRGLTTNLIANSLSWGLYFTIYSKLKNNLLNPIGNTDSSISGNKISNVNTPTSNNNKAIVANRFKNTYYYLISSFTAGLITAALTNPIWVLKTRILGTPSNHFFSLSNSTNMKSKVHNASMVVPYKGLIDGTQRVYSQEGLSAFFRGLSLSVFGVLQAAIQFSVYENLKEWKLSYNKSSAAFVEFSKSNYLIDDESLPGETIDPSFLKNENNSLKFSTALTSMDYILLSAASKSISSILTYPYQVLRSRVQQIPKSYLKKNDKRIYSIISDIYCKQGISGFYSGLTPNLVRVLPATCITFLVYEEMLHYLTQESNK